MFSKNLSITALGAFSMLPVIASAKILDGGDGGDLGEFVGNTMGFIDQVIIPFILSIGFLVFVWGMFKYFIQGGANDEAKESGKSLIMYAIAGYVVILAFWGIVNILSSGIGLSGDSNTLDNTPVSTPGSRSGSYSQPKNGPQ